jgi:hypothetical protein
VMRNTTTAPLIRSEFRASNVQVHRSQSATCRAPFPHRHRLPLVDLSPCPHALRQAPTVWSVKLPVVLWGMTFSQRLCVRLWREAWYGCRPHRTANAPSGILLHHDRVAALALLLASCLVHAGGAGL